MEEEIEGPAMKYKRSKVRDFLGRSFLSIGCLCYWHYLRILISPSFILVVLNAQIEDVIDDIISLESSLNDEFMTLIDSQLPNTVCSNILNRLFSVEYIAKYG